MTPLYLTHPKLCKKILSKLCDWFGHKMTGHELIDIVCEKGNREKTYMTVRRSICDRCEKPIMSVDGKLWWEAI